MFGEIIVLVLLFISSFFLTKFICFFGQKRKWLDIPDSRSSHSTPTLKCGGLGFALVFLGFVSYAFFQGFISKNEFLALGCSVFVVILGFVDDLIHLSIRIRISIHSIVVLIALLLLGGSPEIPVFSFVFEFEEYGLTALGYVLALFVFVWIINLYNFMDGIDGIAGLEGLFVSCAVGVIVWLQEPNVITFISFALSASIVGFLILNLPPARIFMGDAGSNFLGFILGVLGLITIQHGYMNVWTWGILLGVFVVDGTFTLLSRMKYEEMWYHAHRSHAYQQAAIRYDSHCKVDIGVMLINCFWLFPLAWFSMIFEGWGLVIMLLAYLPLAILVRRYRKT